MPLVLIDTNILLRSADPMHPMNQVVEIPLSGINGVGAERYFACILPLSGEYFGVAGS